MKKFIQTLCLVMLFFLQAQLVAAEYVLPYPSYLPGNKLYRVSEFVDKVKKYWYFGSLTQLKYLQEMSDKHLVEAKTLFEYKQYLLGVRALEKSNAEVSQIPSMLMRLNSEQKSNQSIIQKVNEEMVSHKDMLRRMFLELPESLHWNEENKAPLVIDFFVLSKNAFEIREKVISK